MRMVNQIVRYRRQHPLAFRLLVFIVLLSSVITLLGTGLQLFFDYREDITIIEDHLDQIQDSHVPGVVSTLWDMDEERLATLAAGIYSLPLVDFIEITDATGHREGSLKMGEPISDRVITRTYPLVHEAVWGARTNLGVLRVSSSLRDVYARLMDKVFLILGTQAIKTFLVSAFILLLFQYLVTRHLEAIARFAQHLGIDNLETPLLLDRNRESDTDDELDRLVSNLNRMRLRLNEDIARQKLTEAELRNAILQAEAANRAKDEFLASMSHELRTPLNAVLGFSSVMQDKLYGPLGSEKYEEYVNNIHESGEHLLDLISDILDLSKIEAGALTLDERTVDLSKVSEAVVRLIRPRAEMRRVALINRVNGETPLLFADERRIKQILFNLLSNAIKFTEPGGRASLDVYCDEDNCLSLVVSDTGIGMDEEELEIARQPFGQVEAAFSRKYEGTGLGLPLTGALAELHNASMAVESRKGEGTEVTVRFPADRVGNQG